MRKEFIGDWGDLNESVSGIGDQVTGRPTY